MELETIVVPVDLDPSSLAGLRAAAGLARSTGATLVAVSVIPPGDVAIDRASHEPVDLRADAIAKATRGVEEWLSGEAADVETRVEVVFGDVAGEVVRLAARLDADLIVITIKNRSRVGKLLMGSKAQEIILEAGRPVLTVPKGE